MTQKILRDYRSLWEAWEGEDKAEELEVIVDYLGILIEDLQYGLLDINACANGPLIELLTVCSAQLEKAREIFENN